MEKKMIYRIISSNIRFDNPKDKKHQWKFRKKILSKRIENFEPDLVATQEGRKPQINELNKLLTNLSLTDQHRDWITERMYPCIFINKKRIKLIESGDFWLSKTPYVPGSKSFKSAFPRLCTWIKGIFIEVNRPFIFMNCHLDHIKSSTRKEQLKVLIEELKKINNSSYPIILAGDFNDSPYSDSRKMIDTLLPQLYDPWINFHLPEETSHHNFDGKNSNGSRIDWVLLDESLSALNIFMDKERETGIYPSDHFPIKIEFSV
jgi:endonuclease/exonuclease/phosphatase family metal-dependent hydrolase